MDIEQAIKHLTCKNGFVELTEGDEGQGGYSSYMLSVKEAEAIRTLIAALTSKVGAVRSGAVEFCYVGDVWSLRRKDKNVTIANGIGELINKL